ncbi:MAG: redoxin domain-containing protein [Gammaproteobacteria bacterium]|nr:redoxin domain-containing protein [Gammaproteobacteria bacterium]
MSDRLGEVVVLNFWASGCNVCRKQVGKLDDLAARYAGGRRDRAGHQQRWQ